jgi:hypothetical protein
MKKTFFTLFIIITAILPSKGQEKRVVELTAQEILSRVDEVLRYPKGQLNGSLTHIFPDGRTLNIVIKGSISDEDYLFVLGSYERGDQFKVLYNLGGEDIWVYSLTSLQLFHKIDVDKFDPVLATNFSFFDISNADFQSNYTAKIEGDSLIKGKECYRLRCDPILKKGEYGKITLYVTKTDFIPLKIDYFDSDMVIMKSMSIAQTVQVGGRQFPVRYDMLHVKSGTLSILNFNKLDPAVIFSKDIFRHQMLGQ